MKIFQLILSLSLLFTLGSCIEITDDISFKNDGSGTMKYNVNLSSSRTKINSLLSLDSLNGKKVPSLNEVKSKIESIKNQLASYEGISNVKLDANYTDYNFKLQFDFDNIIALEKAIKYISISESGNKSLNNQDFSWLKFNENSLVRSLPINDLKSIFKINAEDNESLKKGYYMSITRFEKEIESANNPLSNISPNKLNIMLKTNALNIYNNPKSLDNVITLINNTK